MTSGNVQRDIGKKLVNLVLHKYLDSSNLQPINSLLGEFINDLEKAIDGWSRLVYYGAFAVSMKKEMEFMSNTKKEIEIKDKKHLEVAAFGDITTQQTITCLKSTIETLEQGVKYVQI